MNILDHVVTNNIKIKKYQLKEETYNDLKFGTNSFNSFRGTRDPLPVVSITLQGGKKLIEYRIVMRNNSSE